MQITVLSHGAQIVVILGPATKFYYFTPWSVGEIPGLPWGGGIKRKCLPYLGHDYGLSFTAVISSPAHRLGSNLGPVYRCAISEHSHHNSQFNISENYTSARFNAVMRPLPKEGSNKNILF